ncbi:hypothetical protein BJ741DRAFT_712123 [Chytriomyces cf. hyalinus JEL632]|nr:hypothetical protein BJ741DRAFT_712123 [Chytriomyces cf. hyalinus JEL632]
MHTILCTLTYNNKPTLIDIKIDSTGTTTRLKQLPNSPSSGFAKGGAKTAGLSEGELEKLLDCHALETYGKEPEEVKDEESKVFKGVLGVCLEMGGLSFKVMNLMMDMSGYFSDPLDKKVYHVLVLVLQQKEPLVPPPLAEVPFKPPPKPLKALTDMIHRELCQESIVNLDNNPNTIAGAIQVETEDDIQPYLKAC